MRLNDNLVRLDSAPIEVRSAGDAGGDVMFGHFAVFNRWTEIASAWEGNFLERIAPGAFTDTFATRGSQIRVLYDHGHDPQIGNKPLGVVRAMGEDKVGASYEVEMFDASYVNDLKPAIRAGQLGASFRFRPDQVTDVDTPKPSRDNPKGLPERTIDRATLYEFGPVTFPAYPDATAGMRSRTDEFLDHIITDPTFLLRFSERVGPKVVSQLLASLPDDVRRGVSASKVSTDGDSKPAQQGSHLLTLNRIALTRAALITPRSTS
jgi:HK97 family phage prohead protease